MTPSVQSPLALATFSNLKKSHFLREKPWGRGCRFRAPNERDPGAGTRFFTPISNGACFFSSHDHVSREELCPLLHVFISFLFTFSVVNVTLLKAPPAY